MTVNRLVVAVEAVIAAVLAVVLWFAGSLAADAIESTRVPVQLAALALFPFAGAALAVAERNHVVTKAQFWHGVVVSNLELRVAQLAVSGDEDEGVAEDEYLYDEGVEAE